MPQFAYKALQPDGVAVEGLIEAPNRQEALRLVEGRALRPIRLGEAAGTWASARSTAAGGKASDRFSMSRPSTLSERPARSARVATA